MTDANQEVGWFEQRVYSRTNDGIRELGDSLPEEALRAIAKEALRRIAQQGPKETAVTDEVFQVQIESLCLALTSEDNEAAAKLIMKIKEQGASAEEIYLTYLAGAARLLGEWWNESRVSFVDVTIGTGRIYSIVRGMSHLFVPPERHRLRSAVFAAVPGETHTLGVKMAADLFRKEGWDIELLVGQSHEELIAEITQIKPILVGLSCSSRHALVALAKLVIAIRLGSPGTQIMVSGQAVREAESVILSMDVDGVANDMPSAIATLKALWDSSVTVTPSSN